MEHSEVLCWRLITDLAQSLHHHCTLCAFFRDSLDDCTHGHGHRHRHRHRHGLGPTTDTDTDTDTHRPFSDDVSRCSTFYTARTSGSSTRTITPSPQPPAASPHLNRRSLRRTSSPTHYSLRDLHRQQQAASSYLRQQQSEEALQRVYESQILEYLNSKEEWLK